MEEKIKEFKKMFEELGFIHQISNGKDLMNDFLVPSLVAMHIRSKKDVIEEIKKMKRKEFKLIPGGVQKCSKNHTWFCDCPAYNEALVDILLSLRDKEDK